MSCWSRDGRIGSATSRIGSSATIRITATPVALDLARPDAAAELRRALDAHGIGIQSLVNNAGFGMKGAFVDADPARIAEMVQLNVASVVSLTREFLPDLVRTGHGALVSVASTGAYQPCPNMAVYGATKAFVLSFTEALAYETRECGLSVLTVSPGATRTEFFDVVGTRDAAVGRFQTTEQVVTRALRELDRASTPPSFVSGRLNATMAKLAGIIPRRLALDAERPGAAVAPAATAAASPSWRDARPSPRTPRRPR